MNLNHGRPQRNFTTLKGIPETKEFATDHPIILSHGKIRHQKFTGASGTPPIVINENEK